jgi:hypothetical protein
VVLPALALARRALTLTPTPPTPQKNKKTVYRYLLFKSSREELVKDVDDLKKKITGEL